MRSTAAFEAPYAVPPSRLRLASTEAMVTMEPPPVLRIRRAAARTKTNVPLTFTR